MSEDDKRLAAFTIERMLKGRHFNICKVDDAAKLLGITASGKAYDRLRALHCVQWGDIPPDIMKMVPVWLNEALAGPRVSVMQIPALREGNVHGTGFEDTPLIGAPNE